ncbi:hypothetical protein L1987_54555 [Smallanthus sonchifolius]|uniref:Uncharacterized protein n=1 Tax=Smallanthus sonchifolius TaxID=185202 RepID=A0ACB9E7U5_9ASTR|nr:hypothetical protein L1987_54555 [Smallanthus sonchifolius]
MEKRNPAATGGILHKIKKVACLDASPSDTGKGKSKSSDSKVFHGFHLVEGKSGHDMEDYHVAEYRTIQGHVLGLFAIFDGHLGDRVPSYLKDNLFNNILSESIFWKDPEKAIKNAYRSTDKFIIENVGQLGPGGSTAVTAIVIDGRDLWVANIGDSRAVLCERGSANQLTVDHEPHVERRRIEKQGGFVTTLPGSKVRMTRVLPSDIFLSFFKKDLVAPTSNLYASLPSSKGGIHFEKDATTAPPHRNVRGRKANSKSNEVDYEGSSDEDNGNGYEDEDAIEIEKKKKLEWENEMRLRLKEIEDMRELEKKAEELQSGGEEVQGENGDEGEGDGENEGSEETEEQKRTRVRRELEKCSASYKCDVPRVNGQLAVARAFGDQSLKAHLSSEPDIRHVPIDATIELVILASDGLWKVMSNHEAVEMVKSIKDPLAATKRLTTEALARKSKDDISCIVIRFG